MKTRIALLAALLVIVGAGCKTSSVVYKDVKFQDSRLWYKTDWKFKASIATNGTMTVESNVDSAPDAKAVTNAGNLLIQAGKMLLEK